MPADLTRLPSLGLGQLQHDFSWDLFGPDGAQAIVKHKPCYITRDMFALRRAAVAGVGIVQLPNMMVRDELARGELLHVVPNWAPQAEIIHAVFASRRGLLPSVRALIDFLAAEFEALDEE